MSNLGRVKTLPRLVDRGSRGKTQEPERITFGGKHAGYRRVALRVDNVGPQLLVHRLVAEAFIGPVPEGLQVCHNDGNRSNNAVTNLRYDTAEGNAGDRRWHGTEYKLHNTHCPHGHAYAGANLMLRPTASGVKRVCRTCHRIGGRERRRIQKGYYDRLGITPPALVTLLRASDAA